MKYLLLFVIGGDCEGVKKSTLTRKFFSTVWKRPFSYMLAVSINLKMIFSKSLRLKWVRRDLHRMTSLLFVPIMHPFNIGKSLLSSLWGKPPTEVIDLSVQTMSNTVDFLVDFGVVMVALLSSPGNRVLHSCRHLWVFSAISLYANEVTPEQEL